MVLIHESAKIWVKLQFPESWKYLLRPTLTGSAHSSRFATQWLKCGALLWCPGQTDLRAVKWFSGQWNCSGVQASEEGCVCVCVFARARAWFNNRFFKNIKLLQWNWWTLSRDREQRRYLSWMAASTVSCFFWQVNMGRLAWPVADRNINKGHFVGHRSHFTPRVRCNVWKWWRWWRRGVGLGVGGTWNFPAKSSSASGSEFGVGKTGDQFWGWHWGFAFVFLLKNMFFPD